MSGGSITSNFGDINIGTSVVTAGSLMVSSNIGHTGNPNLISLETNAVTINKPTTINGLTTVNSLNIGGTTLSSTAAANINDLDNITASASELSILDGVTVSKDNINQLTGVTSSIKSDLLDRYTKGEADNTFAPKAGSTLISTIGTVTTGSLEGNTSIDTSGELKTTNKVTAGSLAVDNVLVDGSTIGHSANASLMTLSGIKSNC